MKNRAFDDNYDDIINLPHHISKTRPQMSMRDRGAQFSPFSALVGHEEAVKKTEDLNEEHVALEITKLPIDDI